MAAKGQATFYSSLYVGLQAPNTKVTIKSYPDLLGSPDNVEVTDCDDDTQKNVPGVASSDSIDFTANFKEDVFNTLNSLIESAGENDMFFRLVFGDAGQYGAFAWEGKMAVRISGADVNSAREMVVSLFPSTEIIDDTQPVIWIEPSGPVRLHGGESIVLTYRMNVTPDSVRGFFYMQSTATPFTVNHDGLESNQIRVIAKTGRNDFGSMFAEMTCDGKTYRDSLVINVME